MLASLARAQSASAGQNVLEEHWTRIRYGTTSSGSAYVPLDSWVYPAFARLIAWGYVDGAFAGLRPWTRLSCVRMLAQSEEFSFSDTNSEEARRILIALKQEFLADYQNATAEVPALHGEVDSVYTRSLGIAGSPLNDSFHFGQTLINDYGRPYQEGVNEIAGFNARLEDGRFSLNVGGEYQYAPGRAAYSDSVRAAIAFMDNNPIMPATRVPPVDTFRLIDANLSVNVANHEISVGKSEMWWGPAEGGAFAFSDNAEPIYTLRINRTEPLVVPLFSKLLGPVRYDLFVGPLKGHVSPVGPWIQGQKISFQPSPNFEFGVSRTIVFAGKGHVPLTFGSFWNSFTSFSNVPVDVKFSARDPGDRYSTFDFSYRLPFVRDWVTLYTDSIVHDDVSPLSAPRRAGFRPGVLLSHFPKMPNLDFRAEASYTDFPTSRSFGGQYFFYEAVYHDAYTNKGFLLGDWVGREGKGAQAWLTYHLSAAEMIQISYRNAKSAPDFVPGGTTQNDISLSVVRRWHRTIEVSASGQMEFWKAPILATGLRTDAALALQIKYLPQFSWTRR